MREPHERLRDAREKAGYEDASEAARALGIPEPTYLGHENGHRGFKNSAEQYARKFGVSLEWLLTGRGHRERGSAPPADRRTVQLVGYVGAGSEAHFYGAAQGPFEQVPAPDGATEDTVAVEVRGESLGSVFDRWLAYYDDVRRPVTSDLIGKLCVVGLEDGRVLIKKLQRSRTRGLYHLLSQTEAPMLDVALEWAAEVTWMRKR